MIVQLSLIYFFDTKGHRKSYSYLSVPLYVPWLYIISMHVDQHLMPAVCQCPLMYLLFSLLYYCSVIRLSQTAHLSLWIGTVVCVTDESFSLSGDSLRGGANFCAFKHWQSCTAPWWETGPRHLIDWHTNVTRWLRTPQAQKHKDRRRAVPFSTHRNTLGHTEWITAH